MSRTFVALAMVLACAACEPMPDPNPDQQTRCDLGGVGCMADPQKDQDGSDQRLQQQMLQMQLDALTRNLAR
jgi:hypothetical protein